MSEKRTFSLYNKNPPFAQHIVIPSAPRIRLLVLWICPYISRHLLSLNPLQARCRRYSRGER
ncbi:hypothetical protein FCX52_24375 [Escherichia coli]|nr:hypothetical protein [Escherichia coli]